MRIISKEEIFLGNPTFNSCIELLKMLSQLQHSGCNVTGMLHACKLATAAAVGAIWQADTHILYWLCIRLAGICFRWTAKLLSS